VDDVEAKIALFGEELSGRASLGFASGAQVDIGPAGEAVLGVPGTFTVA
jgi:hypothetical protein